MQVSTCIEVCSGHRLQGYAGGCGHPHGHNYQITATSDGNVDAMGFVLDFKVLRQKLKDVTAPMDHAMVLSDLDPLAEWLSENHEPYVVLNCNPTAENIASWLFNRLQDEGLRVQLVVVRETEHSLASTDKVDRAVRAVRIGR